MKGSRYIAYAFVLVLLIPSIVTATQSEWEWLEDHVTSTNVQQVDTPDEQAVILREAADAIKPEEFSINCRPFALANEIILNMMADAFEMHTTSFDEGSILITMASLYSQSDHFKSLGNDCRLGI